MSAEIYSIRPCPCGCSLSAGRFANFTPTIVTTEDAVSDRLLKASAMTAILPANHPTPNFTPNNKILARIPINPEIKMSRSRPSSLVSSCFSNRLINHFANIALDLHFKFLSTNYPSFNVPIRHSHT